MKKHKMAGFPVMIESGPLKGKYFKVIDYFQNQYQGKSMEKLAKTKHELLGPVKRRGFELDSDVVFGILMYKGSTKGEHACVHDKELQVQAKPDLKIVKKEEEKEDATTTTDSGDNQPTQPGEPESIGRSVPSGKGDNKPKRNNKDKG